jgi:hypothetical protein
MARLELIARFAVFAPQRELTHGSQVTGSTQFPRQIPTGSCQLAPIRRKGSSTPNAPIMVNGRDK